MTKKQAIEEAKERRAKGERVKVVKIVATYTQPFRGITVSTTYEVRPA